MENSLRRTMTTLDSGMDQWDWDARHAQPDSLVEESHDFNGGYSFGHGGETWKRECSIDVLLINKVGE